MVNPMGVGRGEKELEREESGRERRRHKRGGRGYQGDVGPIKILSVSRGVITGEDVQREDINKRENLAFDEGKKIHILIQPVLMDHLLY